MTILLVDDERRLQQALGRSLTVHGHTVHEVGSHAEATAQCAYDALREQALRRTAAGVDDSVERYMREHEIEEVWSVADRVAENPTLVVLRHVPQGRWRRFFRSLLVDQLLGKLVDVDIHLEEEDAG